jgi:hypothetical protein
MINKYIISCDGQYYCGLIESDKNTPCMNSNGFHNPIHDNNEALFFSINEKDAHIVEGTRNLKSTIEKIMIRINPDIKEIKIEKINEFCALYGVSCTSNSVDGINCYTKCKQYVPKWN